jgi:hypothetical protein
VSLEEMNPRVAENAIDVMGGVGSGGGGAADGSIDERSTVDPWLKVGDMKEALDEAVGYDMVMAKVDWLDSTLKPTGGITRRLWVRV